MEVRDLPRNSTDVRPEVIWNIAPLVSVTKLAYTRLIENITQVSNGNLSVILAKPNPAKNVIGHYLNNERREQNIPQLQYDRISPDSVRARMLQWQIEYDLDVINLGTPRQYVNRVDLAKSTFEQYAKECSDLIGNLQENLEEERNVKERFDGFQREFDIRYQELCEKQVELSCLAEKCLVVLKMNNDRCKKWCREPNAVQKQYFKSLGEQTEKMELIREMLEHTMESLQVPIERFVKRSEFIFVYKGGLCNVPRIALFSNIQQFQDELESIHQDVAKAASATNNTDVLVLVNALHNYSSDADFVCTEMRKYVTIVSNSTRLLIDKHNVAADELARIRKVMPLFNKDIKNYIESFAEFDTIEIMLDKLNDMMKERSTGYYSFQDAENDIDVVSSSIRNNSLHQIL